VVAPLALTAVAAQGGQEAAAHAAGAFEPFFPGLIVLLPLLGFLANGWLALEAAGTAAGATRVGGSTPLDGPGGRPSTHTLPTWIGPGVVGLAFLLTLVNFVRMLGAGLHEPVVVHYWTWMATGTFTVEAALQLDPLSLVMMMVVTGVGFLIHVFSVGYMREDPAYPRYFAYLNLFLFFMLVLVMGASFPLMFVGWEGVGLCSYLLIGFWYGDREKSDAGKKAFIVNRIGDLGLALGLFLAFVTFGSIEYAEIFSLIDQGVDAQGRDLAGLWQTWTIPLLLMVGAFGKSAQLPLYVWLPDAMEGPTPVSALIHAATMVTAGVYLIARFFPLFAYEGVPHYALDTVAWVGALTALLAATIGMAQFDIKRIMAYSTVSQLGYMFAGLGVLTTVGAASHVFTHAFFKALLFLACGAVMHGFAGQLDLRKLSGLRKMKGWGIVSITMLIGCLNLAGFPLITAGYWSKDVIMAEAFVTPVAGVGSATQDIGWILLLTAGLTAYYTFRVYFRVFEGPVEYHPGDEHHDHDHDDEHGSPDQTQTGHDHGDEHVPAEAEAAAHHHDDHQGGFHPHAPGWAINSVLVILAVCSFAAIGLKFMNPEEKGWVGSMVHDSTAYYASPYTHHGDHDKGERAFLPVAPGAEIINVASEPTDGAPGGDNAGGHAEAGTLFGGDPHVLMYYVSAVVGLIGIAIAYVLHLMGRREAETALADKALPFLGPIPRWAQNKWYVDELYDIIIRLPLKVLAGVFYVFDALVIDGLVNLAGKLPRMAADAIRPSQNGILQNYATSMAAGIAALALILWLVL
jgi:NADH-quinone oxidoreductase subunit L